MSVGCLTCVRGRSRVNVLAFRLRYSCVMLCFACVAKGCSERLTHRVLLSLRYSSVTLAFCLRYAGLSFSLCAFRFRARALPAGPGLSPPGPGLFPT